MIGDPPAGRPASSAPPTRRVVATHELGELWLALCEGGAVVELTVVPEGAPLLLGAIMKGLVTRLAPSVGAAFVDLGFARDVFVPLPEGRRLDRPLAEGDEVLVQVTREAQGGKGWRARLEVAIPGWTLVLAPSAAHRGVSQQILDSEERARLRCILRDIAPTGFGLIARTKAAGLEADQLILERDRLLARWDAIRDRAQAIRAPGAAEVDQSPTLAFLREQMARGVDDVVVDPDDLGAVSRELEGAPVSVAPRVRAHPGPLPATEAWGLERAWETALAEEVRLPSGGRLIVQRTEALVAIDVDSGPNGAEDLEETALSIDLEAAAEVARQVRLRSLGGLIVVDFIDVRRPGRRARLTDALAQAFAGDRLRTRIAPLSEFCVAEITRQRRRRPLAEGFTEPCPGCRRGVVLTAEAEARRLLRDLRRRCRGLIAPRLRVRAAAPALAAAQEIVARWGDGAGLPKPSSITWVEGPAEITVR